MNKLRKLSKQPIALNLIAAVLFVSGFLLVLNFSGSKQDQRYNTVISKNFVTSNGKIIDESFKKGHSILYQFTYKGQRYESWTGANGEKFEVGKCYLVWLDSTDPDISVLKPLPSSDCP